MVPSTPIEKIIIRSEISGKIIFIKQNKEQNYISDMTIIKIDDTFERSQIKHYEEQINLLDEIVSLKKENSTNKSKVTRLNQYDKNVEKINYLESARELSSLKLILTQVKLDQKKKIFKVKNRYLQRLHVKQNERIQIGENLMTLYDTNTIKLVAYIPKKEINSLKQKKVLFNGEKGTFKLHSIDKLTDETHLSSYRVEFRKDLNSPNEYLFGQLVTIEVLK